MDELVQLIFFAAIILFGVLGRKKKRPPIPKPAQPRPAVKVEQTVPRQPPLSVRREAAEAQSALVRSAQERPAKTGGVAEELLKMLQQRLEIPEEPEVPPEPVKVESVPETLETLEPAGGKSHDRFHERYMNQESGDRSYEELKTRKQRLVLSRSKLQHAFIMKEIIGPPKGID